MKKGTSPLDIIFLSYDEKGANENWVSLKSRFPRAKRVDGVTGIFQAHQAAARQSETPFFFIVDGDNRVVPEFCFETPDFKLCEDTVYVWRCKNPVNDLCYGYGAIKLYNKQLLKPRFDLRCDLAMSISSNYQVVHELASETHFHLDAFEAWRGAFRECAKLSRQYLKSDRKDLIAKERLETWCTKANKVIHSEWCLLGAKQGRKYGFDCFEKGRDIALINDYKELSNIYKKSTDHQRVIHL